MLRRLAPLALVLLAAGCGGSGGEDAAAPLQPADSGPVHVHGLGVDPADGALYIATHTGLWRSPKGELTARRVTDNRQDTMGFGVVGPGSFLGSGHPDLREAVAKQLPPHLGLIASRNAGKTWRNVSLLGEADLHVLRAAGKRVYGWDASNGRLLVSADGGESWTERPAPAPLLDLAVDPSQPRRVVAATEQALFASTNAGRSWTRLSGEPGLLAWPRTRRLFLAAGTGLVFASGDGGKTWQRRGDIGGEPAAFGTGPAGELYVALHDGPIKTSADGTRWTVRLRP